MRQILASLGLVTVGDEHAWAVTSPDDRFRYVLARIWDLNFDRGPILERRPLWVFGMLNPSKARGAVVEGGVRRVVDDPTIRKCTGFARRSGAGGFLVVNALAYSATDPQDMVRAFESGVDVRGPHNTEALTWALSQPVILGRRIAAWGKIPPKLRSVACHGTAQFLESDPECFGVNQDGSPKHPLMLSYQTPLVRFTEAC